ncbi:MAG: acetate--CoA ligase family protein, partial [Candidatus Binatia bacterium]
LDGVDAPVWLGMEDLAAMLRACDIALAESVEVTPEAAAAAAERLGYPLVAKVTNPPILHKSDVGAVVLHLNSADDVRQAVAAMTSRLAARGQVIERVLLQREVAGGIETLVGVTVDPVFGPLVVVGMGGVLVELLKDVAFHLVPVSDVDAEEMLAKLRSSALLAGYRGAPPGDRAALVGLIQRVSALVEALPELVELDLNPVKVLTPGSGAIAVDGRLRLAPLSWHAAQLQADARPPKEPA